MRIIMNKIITLNQCVVKENGEIICDPKKGGADCPAAKPCKNKCWDSQAVCLEPSDFAEVERQQAMLEQVDERIQDLEKEIKNLKRQGADTSAQEVILESLRGQRVQIIKTRPAGGKPFCSIIDTYKGDFKCYNAAPSCSAEFDEEQRTADDYCEVRFNIATTRIHTEHFDGVCDKTCFPYCDPCAGPRIVQMLNFLQITPLMTVTVGPTGPQGAFVPIDYNLIAMCGASEQCGTYEGAYGTCEEAIEAIEGQQIPVKDEPLKESKEPEIGEPTPTKPAKG